MPFRLREDHADCGPLKKPLCVGVEVAHVVVSEAAWDALAKRRVHAAGSRWRFRERHLLHYAFIHIPKTGGSSIERALGIPLPEHRTAIQKRAEMGSKYWERKFTFAIVRNPYDRAVSYYLQWASRNTTDDGTPLFSFPEWVRATYVDRDPRCIPDPVMIVPQRSFVFDEDDQLAVDFLGRFERLSQDWDVICERLGIAEPLPHERKTERGDYHDYYDAASRALVEEEYAADLDVFKYVF